MTEAFPEGDVQAKGDKVYESLQAIQPEVDFYSIPLHYVLESPDRLRNILSQTKSSNKAHFMDANAELKGRLRRIIGNSDDGTAKSDLKRTFTKLLVLRVSQVLDCTKVAFGCNATYFAVHTLCAIIKGLGFSLPADIHYMDARWNDFPPIIYPLRDCVSKEIRLICHFHRLQVHHAKADVLSNKQSLNDLCKDFIFDLQNRLPSTVSTILKTAAKLNYNGLKVSDMGQLDLIKLSKTMAQCRLCSALMHKSCESNGNLENKQDTLCYNCSIVYRNMQISSNLWSELSQFDELYLSEEEIEHQSMRTFPKKPICAYCKNSRAVLKRPKTRENVCKECFYEAFEEEIHETIISEKLFKAGDRVAIGASGGKDSTVLIHVLKTLNERHNYGLELFLLSIDEGIKGYRDDSLETVNRNEKEYQIPLKVLSYKDLYGWSMDEIVSEIGLKNNCTFCGVFRRQALDRGAVILKANKIVTGHNADDIAETIFLNILRGDFPRLLRCTNSTTGEDSALPRCKPFKYTYEKEIVMYAFHKRLDYFATECTYSPNAYRGYAREFIKELEVLQPSCIVNAIVSGDKMKTSSQIDNGLQVQGECTKCGYITSQAICKACVLLDGLNSGNAKYGITRNACKPLKQKRQTIRVAYE